MAVRPVVSCNSRVHQHIQLIVFVVQLLCEKINANPDDGFRTKKWFTQCKQIECAKQILIVFNDWLCVIKEWEQSDAKFDMKSIDIYQVDFIIQPMVIIAGV